MRRLENRLKTTKRKREAMNNVGNSVSLLCRFLAAFLVFSFFSDCHMCFFSNYSGHIEGEVSRQSPLFTSLFSDWSSIFTRFLKNPFCLLVPSPNQIHMTFLSPTQNADHLLALISIFLAEFYSFNSNYGPICRHVSHYELAFPLKPN